MFWFQSLCSFHGTNKTKEKSSYPQTAGNKVGERLKHVILIFWSRAAGKWAILGNVEARNKSKRICKEYWGGGCIPQGSGFWYRWQKATQTSFRNRLQLASGIHQPEDCLQDLTTSGALTALPFSLSASFSGRHLQGVALQLQPHMPEI